MVKFTSRGDCVFLIASAHAIFVAHGDDQFTMVDQGTGWLERIMVVRRVFGQIGHKHADLICFG